MNLWDALILLLIAAALFFAVRRVRKERSSGCGSSCAGCPGYARCAKKDGKNQESE